MKIKQLILFTAFLILGTYQYAYAQDICPASMVCYSKPDNARISKDLTELETSRVVIGFFQQERTANAALVTAYQNALKASNDLTDALKSEVLTVQQYSEFQNKLILALEAVIDKMQSEISKPKSKWSQVLHVLERVMDVAVGLGISKVL